MNAVLMTKWTPVPPNGEKYSKDTTVMTVSLMLSLPNRKIPYSDPSARKRDMKAAVKQ